MQERQYGRNAPRRYGGSPAPPGGNLAETQPKKFFLKEKIGEMLKYGLPLLDSFPRRERKLADTIRNSAMEMFRLAIRLEKKYYKKTTLEDLYIELAVLKEFVVIAADKDYRGGKHPPPLTVHQREVWSRYNVEIGNMIGGYKKYLNANAKGKPEQGNL